MLPVAFFRFLSLASMSVLAAAASPDLAAIFKNPVITRVYQQTQYTLKGKDVWENNNVSIQEVANSLAALKPTYVSSTIRLEYNTNLTQEMIDGFNEIRNAVLLQSPNAKFDIELSLKPNAKGYPNGNAAVQQMRLLNSQLPIDGWWFDFLSTAQKYKSEWVAAVANYAHNQNQTIGGNVFNTTDVPPNIDAISFDDGKDPSNTEFGYGINSQNVKALVTAANGTLVLGHLNCNPQNNPDTTESCVYMRNFTAAERSHYLHYWISEQRKLKFTYMLPLFYPLCTGAGSYSPLKDEIAGTNETVYDHILAAALRR